MITKEQIIKLIEEKLKEEDLILVDIEIKPTNKIFVYIDSEKSVTIDDCIKISRAIEFNLDRDVEDFSLEVSTPGLNQPFIIPLQYKKNINKIVEVITLEGERHEGKLLSHNNNKIELEIEKKIKNKNKKQTVIEKLDVDLEKIKSTKAIITF
ncbi:MAG: ribosome assembly cofactor RimP [Bacteroidetes bacterium]|nr:ribosome assembly cofactor RimP [Bacteroidota bacterium]